MTITTGSEKMTNQEWDESMWFPWIVLTNNKVGMIKDRKKFIGSNLTNLRPSFEQNWDHVSKIS